MKEQIIPFLRNTESYISGEEISRRLKISRAGIWKYMQELRKDGYDIVAVPHLGYKLINSPDKLTSVEIQQGLPTRFVGQHIEYFESIDSTMNAAFRLGFEGAPEGTVVLAEEQKNGKGRLGRKWVSPKGKGIYMSVIFRPNLKPNDAAQLTLLSAVAVCEAVNKLANIDAKIKWPNDLLVKDKKIAGILTELNAEVDKVKFVVVGIGVNVNSAANLLPEHATSIKKELKVECSRVELTRQILINLEVWYLKHKTEGFESIIKRWKELSATLGRRVKVGNIIGTAEDLDKSGSLIIKKDNGEKIKNLSGDVIFI